MLTCHHLERTAEPQFGGRFQSAELGFGGTFHVGYLGEVAPTSTCGLFESEINMESDILLHH
jgi:hypothetical protein